MTYRFGRPLGDRLALLCIVAAAGLVASGYFGRYAFDDSYVGYAYARNLAQGYGFRFDPSGGSLLATSAPLAVPLYAVLALLFRRDVVDVAQACSAVALCLFGVATFAVLRVRASTFGAAAASVATVTSPIVGIDYSHETLLYAATLASAFALIAHRRPCAGAVALGFAALFRGEALVALPFAVAWCARRDGRTIAARVAVLGIAAYVAWTLCAFVAFGTPFSTTIAAKAAQLRYGAIVPYDTGLHGFVDTLYGDFGRSWFPLRMTQAVKLVWLLALLCGLVRTWYVAALGFVTAATALYIALQLPFYTWFAFPMALGLALTVAIAWPRERVAGVRRIGLAIARFAALAIVLINVVAGATLAYDRDRRDRLFGWTIMPDLAGNAYRELAQDLARRTRPRDRIAFDEFGRLHYEARRSIVEPLGLITPGAIARLESGNAIWVYERYRPEWIVETDTFHYFVDPVEYDWFARAYHLETTLVATAPPLDPARSRFRIYRRSNRGSIPKAKDVVAARASAYRQTQNGLQFTFDGANATRVEARVSLAAGCRQLDLTLRDARGARIASAQRTIEGSVRRLAFDTPPLHATGYALTLAGCALEPAPQNALRSRPVIFGNPQPPAAEPQAALRLYR